MFNLEFEIGLNDVGRPVIEPTQESAKNMNLPEYKFMTFEYTRTLISGIIRLSNERKEQLPLTLDEINRMMFLEVELQDWADKFAVIIKNQFELMGVADKLMNKNFDVAVLTMDDRDALNYNGIIFNDQIFTRKEGLRVRVMQSGQVFQLLGGVDNQHWAAI